MLNANRVHMIGMAVVLKLQRKDFLTLNSVPARMDKMDFLTFEIRICNRITHVIDYHGGLMTTT